MLSIDDHIDWLRQVQATIVTDAYFEVSWKPCVCNEFGRFCAAQEATKIGRNVYLLLDAVSHTEIIKSKIKNILLTLSFRVTLHSSIECPFISTGLGLRVTWSLWQEMCTVVFHKVCSNSVYWLWDIKAHPILLVRLKTRVGISVKFHWYRCNQYWFVITDISADIIPFRWILWCLHGSAMWSHVFTPLHTLHYIIDYWHYSDSNSPSLRKCQFRFQSWNWNWSAAACNHKRHLLNTMSVIYQPKMNSLQRGSFPEYWIHYWTECTYLFTPRLPVNFCQN